MRENKSKESVKQTLNENVTFHNALIHARNSGMNEK